MEQRLHLHARVALVAAAVVAALAVPRVVAAQQTADELFQAGVSHYEQEHYREAANLFAKSYEIDPKTEVLFAWAQCERLSGNCEKAIELYDKLLTAQISAKTRKAVEGRIAECRASVGSKTPEPEPRPEPEPEPRSQPEPEPGPSAPPSPAAVSVGVSSSSSDSSSDSGPAWYKDPVGGALLGTGVVALGVGVGLYVSANSLNSQAGDATDDAEFNRLHDKAQSRGRLGIVSMVAGGALVAAGVTWYVWRPVTFWADDSAAGVAMAGTF